jgi:23S rRNA (guanosine2251-2'-O)-methyltransferase
MRKLPVDEIPRLSNNEYKELQKVPLVLVLDNLRSYHNTGSVFRTTDAFACEAVYLTGITGRPPHREIQKTALGATETVDWHYLESAIECVNMLKQQGYTIACLEIAEGSIRLTDFTPNKDEKIALILGHEVFGVSQDLIDLCDICIEIPQYGTKHSLNVAVSAGIAIWDTSNKMRDINVQS